MLPRLLAAFVAGFSLCTAQAQDSPVATGDRNLDAGSERFARRVSRPIAVRTQELPLSPAIERSATKGYAQDHPTDEGVRFVCNPAQLPRIESQIDAFLRFLNIPFSQVVKNIDKATGIVLYTLNTPKEDTDTLSFKRRPEWGVHDQMVSLPAKGGTFRKVETVSQKEIMLALLQHGRLTEFKGEACDINALKDHVGIRQNVVAWTEVLEWGWPNGGTAKWNEKYWKRGTPVPGHVLPEAVNDAFLNQEKYAIGCYTATKLALLQGILDYYRRVKKDQQKLALVERRLMLDHEPLVNVEPGHMWDFEKNLDSDELMRPGKLLKINYGISPKNFVPGDWLYLLNTDPDTKEKTGYEGSNAIYLGRDKFDDFYDDHSHAYSYREKLDEVYQWRHGVFSRSRDADKSQPLSEQDIDRLSQTPANGGILLSLRTTPYLFGYESLPHWNFTN